MNVEMIGQEALSHPADLKCTGHTQIQLPFPPSQIMNDPLLLRPIAEFQRYPRHGNLEGAN
eukprot:Awhi_evm1s6705